MTGPVASQFGRIIGGTQVRDAMRVTILAWFPTYAAEVARQWDLAADARLPEFTALPPFADWQSTFDMRGVTKGPLPLLVITSPGAPSTERRSIGHTATWRVGAGAYIGAQDWNAVYLLGEAYVAVIRSIVLQHASLGGVATATEWAGEAYDEVDLPQAAASIGVMATFDVTVDAVVDSRTGPKTIPPDPNVGAQWPTVEHINVTVERTP